MNDLKKGRLAFLWPRGDRDLAQIDLINIGISRLNYLAREDAVLGSVIVELYCERMELRPPAPPANSSHTPAIGIAASRASRSHK